MTSRPSDFVRAASGAQVREPIAIVGIGCRFPGASTPSALWQLLIAGGDAIGDVPPGRFDIENLYDAVPATPGKVMTRRGGFVEGLEEFDAEFFGISPREAERLDPQQRLLLETAWEAVEDAGIVPARLVGSAAGVFVGLWINEYESRLFSDRDAIDFYMTIGSGRYAASGRLSYFLGLQGPSLTLDTGCSSSLVAVHLACQSLWSGETELALAGGANAIVEPFVTIAYSQSQMMAPDGWCKFGDARADGYVRSDGAGMVVLKPLSKALADGNPIYATIAGSAVTNDGRSSGFLTTPGVEGQEEVLRRAYRDAGISPGRVHYVEAHGTGTRAGDPVELQALGSVLGIGRPADRPCRVGSVKTNIGHTEGAAGIAGLIKAALCLKHRAVPRSLHFETPNPAIPWHELPVVVPRTLESWPSDDPEGVAGVSSFGISGTNAHVVLCEAPRAAGAAAEAVRPLLLPVSAHTPQALTAMASSYRALVATDDAGAALVDICSAAGARRGHHAHRVALAAADRATLLEQLDAFLAGEEREGVSAGRQLADPKVVFVFPGQGSQWLGMGCGLYASEPAFRSAMDECDGAIRELTGWSVVEELMAGADRSRLTQIDVIQPALFAMEVALAALWRSWGVEPAAVVGHSMGEVAAACVAGALTMRDAAQVICRRSQLLKRVSGKGAMAVVELTREEAEKALQGREHLLSVAVSNSVRSTVISGDREAINDLIEELEDRNIFCRPVKVDVASHSPQMDPLRDELRAALAGLRPQPAGVPIYSTVMGTTTDGAGFHPEYWVDNLRKPVLFGDAVQRLLSDGHTIFIEMSPHPILTTAVREGLKQGASDGIAIGSTRREEDERLSMLGSLGAVYAAGHDVEWSAVYPGRHVMAALPAYAFQRERYWIEASGPVPTHGGARRAANARGLIDGRMQMADRPDSTAWQAELSLASHPWLRDHRIHGVSVISAAAYLELASEAAAAFFDTPSVVLTSVELEQGRYLDADDESVLFQVVFRDSDQGATFEIHSRGTAGWTRHVTGQASRDSHVPSGALSSAVSDESPAIAGSDEFYAGISRIGVTIGDGLRSVVQAEGRVSELRAIVRVPEAAGGGSNTCRSHPALLDGAMQLTAALPWLSRALRMPTRIQTFRGSSGAARELTAVLRSSVEGGGGIDITLVDPSGATVVELSGIALSDVADLAAPVSLKRATLQVSWTELPPLQHSGSSDRRNCWLIIGGELDMREKVRDVLAAGGAMCTSADDDSSDAAALGDILKGGAFDGVVLLGSARQGVAGGDASSVELCRAVGIARAVASAPTAPKLWVVTRDAQRVVEGDDVAGVGQAPLWGFGRALAEERPETFGGLIDLDPRGTATGLAVGLADELRFGACGDQVALRRGRRYGPRLTHASLESIAAPSAVRSDGAYLVTGGLGDLGLEVARFLVRRGARRLVLMGRTALPPRRAWASLDATHPAWARVQAVRALESEGAAIQTAAVDIADEAAVRAWIDGYREEGWPPVRGLVHCAGVLAPALLDDMTDDQIRKVMHPKVVGASVLTSLLDAVSLDFVVLFSSVASLLPVPGQANYAAANAFLDGFSSHLRARGTKATTLSWGPWGEIGMAAALGGAEQLSSRGLIKLSTRLATEALDAFLAARTDQVVIAPIDIPTWQQHVASGPSASLTRSLVDEQRPAAEISVNKPAQISWKRDLLGLPTVDERRALLESLLRAEVGRVLKRPADRIDPDRPLRTMGLDSLMGLELRNRLERATDLKLPATLVWNYPTAIAVAEYLGERLGVLVEDIAPAETPAPAAAADDSDDAALAELLQELDGLSDDETRRLLAGEL